MGNSLRRFYIKLKSWEYWPIWSLYFPLGFYYFTLSVRARSFFFYKAVNPCMETGGMYYESKWNIFQKMPSTFYPATLYVDTHHSLDSIISKMHEAALTFPVIAKPDRGERGFGVKKLASIAELNNYRTIVRAPFLIQAYVAYPTELSVFYIRHPQSNNGRVTSLTYKKLLEVVGDGHSTVSQLIMRDDRAFLQMEKIKARKEVDLDYVPQSKEVYQVSPYGNHSLGATFIDFCEHIDDRLTSTFDVLSSKIDGFYYGRFDLRCSDLEDLKMGKNFSIIELNGANAEPAHMYDPKHSFFYAQRTLWAHYKWMYKIASHNHKMGHRYFNFFEFIKGRVEDIRYKKGYMSK